VPAHTSADALMFLMKLCACSAPCELPKNATKQDYNRQQYIATKELSISHILTTHISKSINQSIIGLLNS